MKEKLKSTRGITLIALVVTIIILLILAGVTINVALGENGLFRKSKQAVSNYKDVEAREKLQMFLAEFEFSKLQDPSNYNSSTLVSKLEEAGFEVNGDIVTVDGYAFQVDTENLSVQEGRPQSYKAQHPEEHMPADTGWEHIAGEWNTGYVIKEKSSGNEFVWVPVSSKEEYVKKSGSNNSNIIGEGLLTEPLTDEEVNSLKDDYGDNKWVKNEQDEQNIVNQAGGFWVARYEIGIDNKERTELKQDWTSLGVNDIRSTQNKEPARYISQEKALELSNKWYSSSKVQSGLITGRQWDRICNFIGWNIADERGESWANTPVSTSKLYTAGRLWSSMVNGDTYIEEYSWVNNKSDISKGYGELMIFPTGIFETDANINTSQKNMYDILGNVWEWTTEIPKISSELRVGRRWFG